jgi:aminomethyltransferase
MPHAGMIKHLLIDSYCNKRNQKMFGLSRRIARSVVLKPTPSTLRAFGAAAAEENLKKTAMFSLHNEMGGKMVPFAGYELPVQFEQYGVLKEHLHTREKGCASLFDVSHMGQIM